MSVLVFTFNAIADINDCILTVNACDDNYRGIALYTDAVICW